MPLLWVFSFSTYSKAFATYLKSYWKTLCYCLHFCLQKNSKLYNNRPGKTSGILWQPDWSDQICFWCWISDPIPYDSFLAMKSEERRMSLQSTRNFFFYWIVWWQDFLFLLFQYKYRYARILLDRHLNVQQIHGKQQTQDCKIVFSKYKTCPVSMKGSIDVPTVYYN